jgi:hypothetical protein
MVDKKALSLRDFYSARGFDSDDDDDDSNDSDDSQGNNRFDKSAKNFDAKSTLNKGQR